MRAFLDPGWLLRVWTKILGRASKFFRWQASLPAARKNHCMRNRGQSSANGTHTHTHTLARNVANARSLVRSLTFSLWTFHIINSVCSILWVLLPVARVWLEFGVCLCVLGAGASILLRALLSPLSVHPTVSPSVRPSVRLSASRSVYSEQQRAIEIVCEPARRRERETFSTNSTI